MTHMDQSFVLPQPRRPPQGASDCYNGVAETWHGWTVRLRVAETVDRCDRVPILRLANDPGDTSGRTGTDDVREHGAHRVRLTSGDQVDVVYDELDSTDEDVLIEYLLATLAKDGAWPAVL